MLSVDLAKKLIEALGLGFGLFFGSSRVVGALFGGGWHALSVAPFRRVKLLAVAKAMAASISVRVLVLVVMAHVQHLHFRLRFGLGLVDAYADEGGRIRRPMHHDGALLRLGIADDVVLLVMGLRLGERRRSRKRDERANK
jgi:hypothetical protein